MNEDSGVDYATIKSRLVREREELLVLEETNSEAAAPVELDQSRVGRLSRMDAMRAQAMSMEGRRRREVQLSRIETALQRIASGEFGDCVRCGERIEGKRLEFDPAVLLCIECATAAER